jgi:hypothetical protein
MLTGLVEPKLRVGGFCALGGLEVMTVVSATLPVKPPLGVIVMVEVLPVVAPGATLTDVPPMVKVGAGTDAIVVKVLMAPLAVPVPFWATTWK